MTHGIEEIAGDTAIELVASEYEQNYTITITDRGKGMASAELIALRRRLESTGDVSDSGNAGIGLKNVHDRIGMAFGADYGVSIESEPGLRTSVTLRLPFTDVLDAVGGK